MKCTNKLVGPRESGSKTGVFCQKRSGLSQPCAWLSHTPFPSLQSFPDKESGCAERLGSGRKKWSLTLSGSALKMRIRLNSVVATPDCLYCFHFVPSINKKKKKHCLKTYQKSKTMPTYYSSDNNNFETWHLRSPVGTIDINNSTKCYSHHCILQYHNGVF